MLTWVQVRIKYDHMNHGIRPTDGVIEFFQLTDQNFYTKM